MRKISTTREKELCKIIDPYFVYENGGYLKDNAPADVKLAYEELLNIGAKEKSNRAEDL